MDGRKRNLGYSKDAWRLCFDRCRQCYAIDPLVCGVSQWRGKDVRPRLAQRFSVRPVAARFLRLRPRDLVLLAESAAFPEYLLSSFVLLPSLRGG